MKWKKSFSVYVLSKHLYVYMYVFGEPICVVQVWVVRWVCVRIFFFKIKKLSVQRRRLHHIIWHSAQIQWILLGRHLRYSFVCVCVLFLHLLMVLNSLIQFQFFWLNITQWDGWILNGMECVFQVATCLPLLVDTNEVHSMAIICKSLGCHKMMWTGFKVLIICRNIFSFRPSEGDALPKIMCANNAAVFFF